MRGGRDKNTRKHIIELYPQITDLFNVKAGGISNDHWALKG